MVVEKVKMRNVRNANLWLITIFSMGILDYKIHNMPGVDAFSSQRFFWVTRKIFPEVSHREKSILLDKQTKSFFNDIDSSRPKGKIYVEKRINKPKENKTSKKLSDFFATTIPGMEKVLAKEIQSLTDVELSSITIGKSGVHFRGTKVISKDILYRVILLLYVFISTVNGNGQFNMAAYSFKNHGAFGHF